jgi:hypothetical protein
MSVPFRSRAGEAPGLRVAFLSSLLVALPRAAHEPTRVPGTGERPPVEQVLLELQQKYGANDKKYESLAKKVDKAVRDAIAKSQWTCADGVARPFAKHPLFQWTAELSAAAQAKSTRKSELLAKYPWPVPLELVPALEFGSDRPVPAHENGFIDLGAAPEPVPGFPDLFVNQYLFGLQEIVGWQYRVESGKKLAFQGRGPKDAPVLSTELPAWETLRVYLSGSLPEVPLFAIPRLTHVIHSRLAERRRAESGAPARIDELFGFLDARWNGFLFTLPTSKERMAVVVPAHALLTDRAGFVYRFPEGKRLGGVGDVPFVSDLTQQAYAKAFRGEDWSVGDFINNTPGATASADQFWADCTYLARYRGLIDELVRAVLVPGLRYPEYLAYLDYPAGSWPTERVSDPTFDVPRRHALLLWARAGKDPAKLADLLYDEVLSKPENAFPGDAALPGQVTVWVREHERQLVDAVVAEAASRRAAGGGGACDLEREFSPHATYLDAASSTGAAFVMASFHELNAPAVELVRDTAYRVVLAELGK